MARILIILIFVCMGFSKVQAQNDPVLAGMIYMYTEKAEKELKNQEKVMLMQTTGHIWTKEGHDRPSTRVQQLPELLSLYY